MRRTPLRRGKPIARRAAKRKRYELREESSDYRLEHLSCAACWKPYWTLGFIQLDQHHLLGGRVARQDGAWNWLMLCRRWGEEGCHDKLGHGRENLAVALTIKIEMGEYEPETMQEYLRRFGGEILPDPAPLYPWIVTARATWSDR